MVKNRNKPELAAKWAETRKSLDELFDIAACKCYDKAADNTDIQKIRQNCKCPFEKKFKLVEWKHYCDIKQGREIVIGSIDTRETRLIQERSARKGRDQPAVQRSNSDPFASSVEDLVVEDQSGEMMMIVQMMTSAIRVLSLKSLKRLQISMQYRILQWCPIDSAYQIM